MADLTRYLRDIQGWAASLEVSNGDTLEMLALLRRGHPRAQDFEPTGHGGSDPTALNGAKTDRNGNLQGDTAVLDGKRYTAAIERAWKALREAEDIAHRYRHAIKPERQPNDVQDVWCALHLRVDAHEPRYRNELCRPCAERKYQTGDFPTLDDIRYHMRQGRWPRKPIDPTLHRPDVLRIANAADAAEALTRGQHLAGLDRLREGAQTLEPITSTGTV